MNFFKRKVKFTNEEHIAIKVLTTEYLKSIAKEKNPNDTMKIVKSTLERIKEKVEHVV